jgi:hypothetical protein
MTLPRVSLEEAQQRVQFALRLPKTLPEGTAAVSVLLMPDIACPDRRIDVADLFFAGPDLSFSIMESDRGIGTGGAVDQIELNGEKAQIVRYGPGDLSVDWQHNGVAFSARTGPGEWTEQRFLQILESMP